MGKRQKKEKVIYVDDGRTIADMSGVSRPGWSYKKKQYRASFKEQWQTYWSAVRMMVKPMLIFTGIICVAYGLMYLLLRLGL